ncbi:MAG TPA: hypothetical protein VFL41_08560 [Gaiellaceae bacterium]|nr:hypothetical protein [Gaiellaceae bacterium]
MAGDGEITGDSGAATPALTVGQGLDEDPFVTGSRALKEILAAKPQAEDDLAEILGRRLAGQIDDRTWGEVDAALADYLGDRDAAGVLGWALEADPGDRTRIEELEREAGPEAAGLARGLTARYGVELRDAGALRDFPDNWRSLSHNVYQAASIGQTFISLTIEKQNKERFTVDGPADAAMSLASFLLGALRLAGRDAFTPELLNQFVLDTEDLLKEWRAEEEARSASATN